MKLMITVSLSSIVTPLLAVTSPFSNQTFPVLLRIVILIPAGTGVVNLIVLVSLLTEKSASTSMSAVGLLAPNVYS